jgi:hypothetical protein
MSTGWLVLAEGILVFGGLLAFTLWQLRSLKRMERDEPDEPGLSGRADPDDREDDAPRS